MSKKRKRMKITNKHSIKTYCGLRTTAHNRVKPMIPNSVRIKYLGKNLFLTEGQIQFIVDSALEDNNINDTLNKIRKEIVGLRLFDMKSNRATYHLDASNMKCRILAIIDKEIKDQYKPGEKNDSKKK